MNCPAAIVTDPVAVLLELGLTVTASAEFAIGVPTRSVTVMVFDCCEYTLSCEAVQPFGTHASTPVVEPRRQHSPLRVVGGGSLHALGQ